jgi:cell division septum initiation protein DivIVA
MDILHLVDRLEEVFNDGRPIPLTHKLAVDEDRVLELIDQMRVSIPDEVKKAQQILNQRDKILAQAQEEAQRTVQLAQERAVQQVERETLVEQARVRAAELLKQAEADAEAVRTEADDYVLDVLEKLETETARSLNTIRNGINKLRADRGQAPIQYGEPAASR